MSENGDDKSQQTRRRVMNGPRTNRGGQNRNNNNNTRFRGNRNGENSTRTRAPQIEEKEVHSELVQIQTKRFYIDVKENERGRFLKLAEVGIGGGKSRIILTLSAGVEFNAKLAEFIEINNAQPPEEPVSVDEVKVKTEATTNEPAEPKAPATVIKSDTIIKDQKRYYMDLKSNERGRFLRIAMVMNRGPRAQIAIPALGLVEFKKHFSEILEKYNNETEADVAARELAEAASGLSLANCKSLKVSNKTFYFDLGTNARGSFLRISELRANQFRTNITVPVKSIQAFRDQLTLVLEEKATIDALSAAANDDENVKAEPATTESVKVKE